MQGMSNPERILRHIDALLHQPMELTLYGRGAIALGYPRKLPHHEGTKDIDAIIPAEDLPVLQANEDFWQAQEKVNQALEADQLYFTHIFTDEQVIIQPDWKTRRQRIPIDLRHLTVYRPGTLDLILTKMMRDDPEDLADIAFLIAADQISQADLASAIERARIPEIPELLEQFAKMKAKVLNLVTRLK
jgi:hypothetical protein